MSSSSFFFFFFFNATATTEIYTLSLHDALPISLLEAARTRRLIPFVGSGVSAQSGAMFCNRSEEHTSELQSLTNLVCRLLLEKKNIHYQDIAIAVNVSPVSEIKQPGPVRHEHRH